MRIAVPSPTSRLRRVDAVPKPGGRKTIAQKFSELDLA
jgi:hypothetical protein